MITNIQKRKIQDYIDETIAKYFAPKSLMWDINPRMEAIPSISFDIGESFSELLFKYIDMKKIDEVSCYKKANIDRRLFSKLRNKDYNPSKKTVIALCLALELDMNDANELIRCAGYNLTNNNKFDIIIEYCFYNGIYNIFDVNEILLAFEQKTL